MDPGLRGASLRIALVAVLVVLTGGVLWLAGEQHRKNCIESRRFDCSVLPWDSGERPAPVRLNARGCEQLELMNEYDGIEGDAVAIPPECREPGIRS